MGSEGGRWVGVNMKSQLHALHQKKKKRNPNSTMRSWEVPSFGQRCGKGLHLFIASPHHGLRRNFRSHRRRHTDPHTCGNHIAIGKGMSKVRCMGWVGQERKSAYFPRPSGRSALFAGCGTQGARNACCERFGRTSHALASSRLHVSRCYDVRA